MLSACITKAVYFVPLLVHGSKEMTAVIKKSSHFRDGHLSAGLVPLASQAESPV